MRKGIIINTLTKLEENTGIYSIVNLIGVLHIN